MASTPLYKRLRDKGTTFISFPSSSNDFNVYQFDNEYDMHVSKFILLNIPTSDATGDSNTGKVLNFTKQDVLDPTEGINTYNFDPNSSYPVKYSDKLMESLRNYVANQDTCFRETRISSNKDFYNPVEKKTPTEAIFWKWCRLHNIIDLEPAEHKIDWDKNLSDFDNINASTTTNQDYFRKYLWKERVVREYTCAISNDGYDYPQLDFDTIVKFKEGDTIMFTTGSTLDPILGTGIPYEISSLTFPTGNTSQVILNTPFGGASDCTGVCYLNYHRLVEYVGEVQANSKVQSSQQTFTEFTAMVPSHVGRTSVVLFGSDKNTNYYPGLQIPILDEQIQDEIIGSENLSSPIRTNPSDYPGSYFGYFDTYDKTYATSAGDPIRYSGDYYGLKRVNNIGLVNDDYVETLDDFNSNNIDGLYLDFNLNHYYRSQNAGQKITNFDEFNTLSINDNPPEDFEFNAILWYYTVNDKVNGTSFSNLYGIEFLDNPDNDFGNPNDRAITTTRKLVTNSSQDGYAYIYNLNLDIKVDNDMLPLRYDPTSIYNIFGFDLYNKVMSNYVLLSEQFRSIIGEFININNEIVRLKSLIYSQTDVMQLKDQLNNMEYLISMYKTNQFVDSSTVKITTDYTKNYPALSFNAISTKYTEIYNLATTEIYNYNLSVSGQTTSYAKAVTVPISGDFLVNVLNDMIINNSMRLMITMDKDLSFKQTATFLIRPDQALYTNKLDINVMFYDSKTLSKTEKKLIYSIDMPIDYKTDISGNTYNNSYYMNLSTFVDRLSAATYTTIDFKEDLFVTGDWIYIQDFFLKSGSTIYDYSGLYKIYEAIGIQAKIELNTNLMDVTLTGLPKAYYYKGVEINITRVDSGDSSDLEHRYLINRKFLDDRVIDNRF